MTTLSVWVAVVCAEGDGAAAISEDGCIAYGSYASTVAGVALNIENSGSVEVGAVSIWLGYTNADWALCMLLWGAHVVGDRIGAPNSVLAVVT